MMVGLDQAGSIEVGGSGLSVLVGVVDGLDVECIIQILMFLKGLNN